MKKIIGIISLMLTVLCMVSVFISPQVHWVFGFFSLMVPLLIFFHLGVFLYTLFSAHRFARYSFVALLISLFFLPATFQLNNQKEHFDFSVLNYNVRGFVERDAPYISSKSFSEEMVQWISDQEASVMCFQEFVGAYRNEMIAEKIRGNGGYESFAIQASGKQNDELKGLALFSKYPIVAKGLVRFHKNSVNQAIYADIKIKDKVVRVYNVHLESMAIREDDVVSADRLADTYPTLFGKLKKGFINRAKQVDLLYDHIAECPHDEVIVCGDFNDIPFSYTYFQMKRQFQNAFEEAGKGFGFTYNGKLFFLRIDNQFFKGDIQANKFSTLKSVPYSDHFPVLGRYQFTQAD